MAKGDYSSKWGGSRNAYEKGKKDANESMINRVIVFFEKVLEEYIKATKEK